MKAIIFMVLNTLFYVIQGVLLRRVQRKALKSCREIEIRETIISKNNDSRQRFFLFWFSLSPFYARAPCINTMYVRKSMSYNSFIAVIVPIEIFRF